MKNLFLIAALLIASPASPAIANDHDENVIIVNGIGEVEIPVDNVTLSVNISTRDKSLATSKSLNQKKYDQLLATITDKIGLKKEAIKSNFISINPSYVPCYPTQENPAPKCDRTKVDFYETNRSISLKLEDLSKYDLAIESLANIESVSVNAGQFGVSGISKHHDKAREWQLMKQRQKLKK